MIKKLLFNTLLVGLTFVNGEAFSQNGLKLDGNNDYLQSTCPGVLNNGARTVEAWVKPTSTTLNTQQIITEWGGGAGDGSRFTFKFQNRHLRLETGGAANFIEGTTQILDGNWHHFAVTYDPTSTPQYVLYIDGQIETSGSFLTTTTDAATLQIGARSVNVPATKMNGVIDELRVWTFAKTQGQLQAGMNTEICAPQTGLMAYYKFNQGTADDTNTAVTTATDDSGNSYAATLTNFALSGTTSNWTIGQSLPQQTIDATITNDNAGTLTATLTDATSYQWVDCNDGNEPVPGATSQTFSPTVVGSYAVELTKFGCTVTSDCEVVATLGLNSSEFAESLTMYPNPTSGLTNIQLNQSFETIEATVYNVIGQVILAKEFKNTNAFSLNINGSNGIYFLAVKTNSGENAVLKVVKE